MILISDEYWQRFTYGRYIEPPSVSLTKAEMKVWNMKRMGYDPDAIANRLKITVHRVNQVIVQIADKGY